jgi:putative transposase
VTTFGISERRACASAACGGSSCRYKTKPDRHSQLREQVTELAHEQPRFGYRQVGYCWPKRGQSVNHKRLYRVYHEAGLNVKRIRCKKMVRVGVSQPRLAAPQGRMVAGVYCDAAVGARTICLLSVVDNWTRECLRWNRHLVRNSPRHSCSR